MKDRVISLDTGSTWTKGALWSLDGGKPELKSYFRTPTTTANLADGALSVASHLCSVSREDYIKNHTGIPVFWTSSAKGGLAIAVVGLVPDLSVELGRLAAWGSGGRITKVWPWVLTNQHMDEIIASKPDIILLTGGTDGGHEKNVIHNARIIGESTYDASVIYAGNSYIASEVEKLLETKRCTVVPNLMPDLGTINEVPCQLAIRQEFLDNIVEGRGLLQLVDVFGRKPLPTPSAMLNLVTTINEKCPDFGDFTLIDMGGATTDVYSICPAQSDDSVILRGITEPLIKRSVEGDLGMRVSARSLWEVIVKSMKSATGLPSLEQLKEWTEHVLENTELLPVTHTEGDLDRILAVSALWHSVARHSGRIEQVWTSNGKVGVQRGKDLRKIAKVVLTGGWLARFSNKNFWSQAREIFGCFENDKEILIPEKPDVFTDAEYLWPLFAPLVGEIPMVEQAALKALIKR
ncbi:glutamate mutase L [Myxococcota bacterium]|nr:glutamate mutase L [Myxococcota bacterium]MBU1382654.1 glutamate mutase L [Myxococcota bacterium]MBU1497254.1 glutamate mutase L [Myxococcota bacterium]